VKQALLAARDLHVSFPHARGRLRALDGVDIEIAAGETVALVGESGSGKSTAALALMGVHRPDAGRILFDGRDVTGARGSALKALRRQVQMVLQDPYSSLDPRWSVERILREPLDAHDWGSPEARDRRVGELIRRVGLPEDAAGRRPTEFSGGQRQRISIARALALEPRLVIADEPVSALDVSIQAQIVNLLLDVQRDTGVAYLVISHDIALVHQVSDRVIVLYLGTVVEQGPADRVIRAPLHPYTAALISAVPELDASAGRRRIVLPGEPPSPLSPPSGCAFHPRCPVARDRCRRERPPLTGADAVSVACFYPGELRPQGRACP
jgi:peptide/nickel transport system ATP-binding protein